MGEIRLPLVHDGAGNIQQLQAGDTLGDRDSSILRTFTVAASAGQALYADENGSVDKAQANASGTSRLLGLATQNVLISADGPVMLEGVVVLTTGQWDTVTGDVGGLLVGTKYFVDPSTAGDITTVAPVALGQFVIPVGVALSTTEMNIQQGERIEL